MADAHWQDYLFSELGDKRAARNQKYYFKDLSDDQNEELMTWLLEYICSPGKVGAMAAAPTSPYDPFFFVVHPVYERIWAGMRLQKDTVYKQFDWSFKDDDRCRGHHEDDQMPWDNLYDETRAVGDLLTNGEIIKAMDPMNPALPYMYDSFDFSECG
uniref:Tyrosinase copper-binding domain-containing protein n=1 Tax=Fibrocapsa japonica TaxID=94617 RepID=A0A7S2UWA5_9STRA